MSHLFVAISHSIVQQRADNSIPRKQAYKTGGAVSNIAFDKAPILELLHLAAEEGDDELIQMLIRRGVDVNTVNSKGNSPLLIASTSGEEATVKLLLGYEGVIIDHRNTLRVTPLIEAASHGHSEIVRLLLDVGADVNAQTIYGNSPLSLAAEFGQDEAVAEILKQKNLNVSPAQTDGKTPLHWAALKGYSKIVRLLLDHGADVNARDENEKTPLLLARNRAIAKILQSHGAV